MLRFAMAHAHGTPSAGGNYYFGRVQRVALFFFFLILLFLLFNSSVLISHPWLSLTSVHCATIIPTSSSLLYSPRSLSGDYDGDSHNRQLHLLMISNRRVWSLTQAMPSFANYLSSVTLTVCHPSDGLVKASELGAVQFVLDDGIIE